MKRLTVGVMMFLVGCGGSSVSVQDYFMKQQQIQCEFEVKCCQTVADATVYTSMADCIAATPIDADSIAFIMNGEKAGTLRYDSAAAGRCLSLERSKLRDCGSTIKASDIKDCQTTVIGTVAAGVDCSDETALCAPGLFCNESNVCAKRAQLGEVCYACDSTNENCTYTDCADNLTCDDTSNKCVKLASNGAMCESDGDCSSMSCDTGSMTCTEPIPSKITVLCEMDDTSSN